MKYLISQPAGSGSSTIGAGDRASGICGPGGGPKPAVPLVYGTAIPGAPFSAISNRPQKKQLKLFAKPKEFTKSRRTRCWYRKLLDGIR